jgi:hypothetical protein
MHGLMSCFTVSAARKVPAKRELSAVIAVIISLNLSEQSNTHTHKWKTIRVTGRGGPYGCETSRLSHFLDNRLTVGGEVVNLTRRPVFTPRKIPGTHFCQRLSRPQALIAAGRIRSIEKSSDFICIWTRGIPACIIVLQTTTLLRVPEQSNVE